MSLIYFDNAATTKTLDEVNKKLIEINENYYGNPSSIHRMGINAENILESARDTIASMIGASSNEIVFTSGGTESTNTALRCYAKMNKKTAPTIITTKVEHAATFETLKELGLENYNIKFINVDNNGIIKLDELLNSIDNDTSLVSLIHVNNETGVINPIEKISDIIKKKNKNTKLHIDAVQSFGKLDLKNISKYVDFLSASSHKIHGPKGVGFLYISKDINLIPFITGGGQESKKRSGTVNVPGIAGFETACIAAEKSMKTRYNHVNDLKSYLSKKLISSTLGAKIKYFNNVSPYILSVSFENIKSEILLHYLEMNDIYISTGSACSSKKGLNRVLKGYNMPNKLIDGTIRVSFSSFNSKEEVDSFYYKLQDIVPKIRMK